MIYSNFWKFEDEELKARHSCASSQIVSTTLEDLLGGASGTDGLCCLVFLASLAGLGCLYGQHLNAVDFASLFELMT